jgi:hypothetical protein
MDERLFPFHLDTKQIFKLQILFKVFKNLATEIFLLLFSFPLVYRSLETEFTTYQQ